MKGKTFVQYAGSLNGADFRVILQIAPSVLQGLIPDSHYKAWLALSRLAPLLFQPEIIDLPAYLVRLSFVRHSLRFEVLMVITGMTRPCYCVLSRRHCAVEYLMV